MKAQEVSVFWFRRDLRLDDNTGLNEALRAPWPVLPLFIFDTEILGELERPFDRRVEFILQTVSELDRALRERGSSLVVEVGRPLEVFQRLFAGDKSIYKDRFQVRGVYLNHDYEPRAIGRDAAIEKLARTKGIEFHSFKDQVVFERGEIAKDDGKPYTVFTPYSRKWRAAFDLLAGGRQAQTSSSPRSRTRSREESNFLRLKSSALPTLAELGFKVSSDQFLEATFDRRLLRRYAEDRDRPALAGTSRLGVHLRFGTVSVREAAKVAASVSETWLKELIWREFFMQILANFPHVARGPFRPEFERVQWRNRGDEFERWCRGETGFAIVDAGMRELLETGYMHNRVRMIAASFLVKQLLVDWRWGEAYFAKKLLDFELASNNGNWQWVAGSGCDAAPYFRVFNPVLQAKKFDPDGAYVRRWIPELGTSRYPEPMVDLKNARVRALRAYAPTRKE